MFQSEVREILVQTVHDDIHEIHSLLQFRNPILPLPLHPIQQKDGSGMPSFRKRPRRPGVFIPSLFPEFGRSIVSGKKVDGDLVVMSNVGRGVVQMLLHVVGSIRLKGRGEVEGGGSSVEHGVVGNEGRHSDQRYLRK
jgi:hypothetical protein